MALTINFNISAMRSYQSLVRGDRAMNITTERLSSGTRLNRSADGPGIMAIANTMRYTMEGISQASDNLESGINMSRTADGALSEVSELLNRARGLAISAANEGSNDPSQLQALQLELNGIITSIDEIANGTTFGAIKLLEGSFATNRLERDFVDFQGLNGIEHYESISQDDSRLYAGVQANSEITVNPPDSILTRERVVVAFQGSPASTATINGQTQVVKTGTTQSSTVLALTGGESVVVTGPKGSATIDLQPNTAIGQFVDQVNGLRGLTGASAAYDEATGELVVTSDNYGHGLLNIQSVDMSGGGNVGLLDLDTTSATANALQLQPHFHRMTVADDRTGNPVTGSTLLADLVVNGTTALNDLDGMRLRAFDEGSAEELQLVGPDIDDLTSLLNTHATQLNATASWNATTNTLTIVDDPAGAATTSNIVVGASNNLHDIMTAIDAAITSPDLSYNGGTGIISVASTTEPNQVSLAGTAEEPSTTVQDVLDFFNDSNGLSARAEIVGGELRVTGTAGPLVINSDDLTLGGLARGLLDLNTSSIEDSGGIKQETVAYAMEFLDPTGNPVPRTTALQGSQGNGFAFDDVAGRTITLNDGVNNLVIPLTATSTLQDVVDAVNGGTIGARADYHDGVLRLVATGTTLTVSSDDMTLDGTTNAGIWDEDTTAAGNGKAQLDIDPTTTLSFTDEDGTSHTLTLHQLPGANDGRRFANLTGGPRVVSNEELAEGVVGPRFTGWTEGAWTVDLEERKGTPGGGLVTARDAFSAFRDSNTRIQSGGRTGNTTTLDIADTRAAAIGHSAGLATEGFASMADLRDFDAFVNNQAQSALAVIDAAIEEVSANRGQLGAITSSNLETLSVTLSTEIENLTNAESTLRDADFAKESADFARHQVIVQAATAMLAQANQLPNNVLSLLTDR